MQFIHELKDRNQILFYLGLICFVFAIFCFALSRISATQVLGVSAWIKPTKFFLSTAIFVWSMGWYCFYLDQPDVVKWYSWALVVLFFFEDSYILIQAARGQTSHFNTGTPFTSIMWGLMALAAILISFFTALIGVQFFVNPFAELSQSYLWGIRLGLIAFTIFSFEGLAMGSRMAHTIGAADGSPGLPLLNWSKRYGDLRVAHFLGMHGLQILPLLSFYVLKKPATIIVVGIAYLGISLWQLIIAIQGRPFSS